MWFFICLLFLITGSFSSSCPPLVMGPTEVVATLGSCLYISCRYDLCKVGPGAQLRSLRWLRDPAYDQQEHEFRGQSVGPPRGEPVVAKEGDCSLSLPHVSAGHAGVYGARLVANPTRPTNRPTLWMHMVNVSVTDTPPTPHLWPDPAPLAQGHRTTLGCWVPPACPDDAPTLTWEGPITKAPSTYVEDPWTPPATVVTPPVMGTLLSFEPFWYHNGTLLECILRAPTRGVIARVGRHLQVHYPPRDVWVEVTPSSPIHEGQEVTLSCRDSAHPPSHAYAWTLEGRPLPHGTAQLLLRPTKATDGGSYSCRATNAMGTAESRPTLLEVYYPPRDVRVEVTPSSPIHEGQEVTLSCRDSAHPPPLAYAWTLEGRPLPHGTAQLLLRPTKATDGGSYSCRATNAMGTAESRPTLLEVYYPPRSAILESLTPLPALAGSRVRLRCALGPAHPAPAAVQWLRDDRPEGDTPGPALDFDADPARAGAYRCAARNAAGSALSPPLLVVVWYPPRPVRIFQNPRGPVVAGGGPVRLHCHIGGAAPPKVTVTWLKDGGEVPFVGPDLLLPGPHPSDAAAYACQARNQVGVTRSPPLALDVLFGPRGVALVPEPSPRVEEASDVTLRCHADAHPPPSAFEWFREGRPLGRTPLGVWVLGGVGVGAAGRYRCRVINDIATADSDDVSVSVYYSTPTILRKTFLGLGVGLSVLLVLGTLGCFLHRRWRRRQMAADEEPVVEPSGTFFLRHKKARPPGSPRPPREPDDPDAISYSSLVSPPGAGPVPRLRGDTVVYTVLKRNEGAAKATEGPDYENVPPGPTTGDGAKDGDKEGTLVYAALALSPLGTPRERGGELGDTVEYTALRR